MTLRDHPQDITHWPTPTKDGFGGFTFVAPVLLKGRWEDKQELFRVKNGEEVLSEAVVYIDTDVVIGDYIAENDQTATADPTTLQEAHQVRQFIKIPDLRQTDFERKAML